MVGRKRILLVDDHTETRLLMSRILSTAGFDTTCADGHAQAMQQCRANRFDVLISDLLLMDGHGLDLLQEISKLYPIRGIACSGMGDEERERCLSGGFDAYFCKPIRIDDLVKMLITPLDVPFSPVQDKA